MMVLQMLCHQQHQPSHFVVQDGCSAPAITSAFQLVGRGEGEVKDIVLLFKGITPYHFCLHLPSRKAEKGGHLSKTWEFFSK